MTMKDGQAAEAVAPTQALTRAQLIKDALVFQGKLIIDGLRDLVLLPISIIATVVSLIQGGDKPGKPFYEVIAFGRQTERWINLFGAADRTSSRVQEGQVDNIDTLVDRVETLIVDQYQKGALTESARNAIHRTLESVQRRRSKSGKTGSGVEDAGNGK